MDEEAVEPKRKGKSRAVVLGMLVVTIFALGIAHRVFIARVPHYEFLGEHRLQVESRDRNGETLFARFPGNYQEIAERAEEELRDQDFVRGFGSEGAMEVFGKGQDRIMIANSSPDPERSRAIYRGAPEFVKVEVLRFYSPVESFLRFPFGLGDNN